MAAVAAAAKAPWSQTRLNFGSSGSVGVGSGMGGNKTQAKAKAAKKESDKKPRGEVKPQMMLFEGVRLLHLLANAARAKACCKTCSLFLLCSTLVLQDAKPLSSCCCFAPTPTSTSSSSSSSSSLSSSTSSSLSTSPTATATATATDTMALKRVAAPGLTCPCFQHLPQVSLTSSTLDGVSGFRFVDEALSISLEGFTGTITLNKVLAPSSPKTTKKRKLNEDVLSRTAALRNDDKIPIYSQASMAMDADDDDNDAEAVDCTPFPQNPPVEPEMPSSPSSSSSQVSVVCGGESLGLIDETPSASPPPKTQVVPADPTTRPHSVRRSRQVPPPQ